MNLDNARALLDAKLALEAELVRPLQTVGHDYILACDANGGRPLPMIERMTHIERFEAVLLRHYCRVAMVMAGKRPPLHPSVQEASLSLGHMQSMISRAKAQASLLVSSIEREFERELAVVMPSGAVVDDGTGHPMTKDSLVEVETKADGRAKVTGVTAGMVGRFNARLGAIANVNTNGPAEEARIEIVDDGDENVELVQEWRSLMDGHERKTHHEAHGQVRPISQPFQVGGALLRFPGDTGLGAPLREVINCFPAGTLVSGAVSGAMRHWYDGEIVEITTALGHKLAGTPNHPVLTTKGWVALGALNEGDDVISRSVARHDNAMSVDAKHVDHVEPGIEQVFDALNSLGVPVRVPRLAVDLHGYVPAADVDVVAAEGLLHVGRDAPCLEHVGKLQLAGTNLFSGSLLMQSLAVQFVVPDLGSSARDVGSLDDRLSRFDGRALEAQNVGLTAAARSDAIFSEYSRDRTSCYAMMAGNSEHRLPRVEGASNNKSNGVAVAAFPGSKRITPTPNGTRCNDRFPDRFSRSVECARDVSDAHSGSVEADRVINLVRRQFAGHVYNLQAQYEMYYANGIVVHNCRCFLVTYTVDKDGTRTEIHKGPSAPARRQRRAGDRVGRGERMPANPTSVVTLNGRTRAQVVLGNGRLATMRQQTPSTIVVSVGRTTIARAETAGGRVTSIDVARGWRSSGVEELIRRSVAHSAAR